MIKIRTKTLKIAAKFLGALSLLIGVTYPIIISPMIDSDKYKKIQAVARAGVIQEEIQPGGMKVWSNPFEKKVTEKLKDEKPHKMVFDW